MAQIPWGRVRGVAAAILVVVGLVLAPVSVVVAHARSLLTDTDRFVATFGPLASDRGVQDAVGDAAIAAVDATVDFSALADSALQGLADRLSLPPLVTGALQSVGDGVAGALRSVVDDQIRSIVTSDAFPPLWEQMLRAAHARAVAGIQGDPSAAFVVRGDTLLLQVGPVVDRARQILVDRGSRFASLIPQVDRTVELVEVPGLSAVAAGHGAVVVLGVWLPVATVVLVLVGVLLARRRRNAVLRTGAGLALVAGVLLAVLAAVRAVLAAPAHDPSAVALDRSRSLLRVAAYDAAAGGIVRTAAVLLVLGAVSVLAAHVVGRLARPPETRPPGVVEPAV